ncbi:MAG: hypothetical protein NUV65_00275 [Candidatus Roizmanbacteria bacterium]|nr:hypothetical protein [Candidatus Roizmanbacteria bacterium]
MKISNIQYPISNSHVKQRGQVVIIAALLMSIFAIIGASVATQMVYEQRRAKIEEKSQKAYYAAESAMEDALKLLKEGSYTNKQYSLDGVAVNTTSSLVGSSPIFDLAAQNVTTSSGENIMVDLATYAGTSLTLCWDSSDASMLAHVYYTTTGGQYAMYPFAANASLSQSPKIENAATASVGNSCGKTGWYDFQFDLSTISDIATPDFISAWVLYGDGVSVAFEGDQNLPEQGKIISSTATIPELKNTVTRQLRYYITNRTYPPTSMLYGVLNGGGVSFGPGKNW